MMLHIPEVLTPEQVARCRDVMAKADWVDGNVTAGHQSAQVKYNLQLPEESQEARELGDMVLRALYKSALFMSAVLPQQVFPPLFNRYDAGMTFGAHVDNAIRTHPGRRCASAPTSRRRCSSRRRRTTTAASWWSRTPTAATTVKLPAGDLIVYPGDQPA